ncbi:hypothetical protein IKG06_00820 [Candidatus Saccharibacteria bacterium]|nr:hypothetical protein [Candidatus Saccharibacteria bacterium]
MNYGQTNPSPEQPFFTRGQGTNIESVNNVESENNLDLSNGTTSWNNNTIRNPRNLGNSAMQANPSEVIASPNTAPSTPELARVVNLEMPPSYDNQPKPEPSDQPIAANPDNQSEAAELLQIKTEEHLNPAGITRIEGTIKKLEETGNAADFYREVQALTEENLERSFNRKIPS